MSSLKRNSKVECQNKICNEVVCIYEDYVGSINQFRCGACLPYTTFSECNPSINDYCRCFRCGSQFKYRGGKQVCHLC